MTILDNFFNSAFKIIRQSRCCVHVGLTLCAGIGLSVAAHQFVYGWEQKTMQNNLYEKRDKITANIQRYVNSNMHILQAMGSLYSISYKVKQQEFQALAKSALYRYPSIKAIAWLPLVSNKQLVNEFPLQIESYTGFRIVAKAEPVKISNTRRKSPYIPAYELALFPENQYVTSLNFAANPNYQAALERAVDLKEIFITKPIQIFSNSDNHLGVIVFQPVSSQSSSTRNGKNFTGFVVAILDIERIIQDILQEENLENINVYLQDEIAPVGERYLGFYEANKKRVLTATNSKQELKIAQRAYCLAGNACTDIIQIENRRWLLQLWLTPEYKSLQKYWRSWATLAIGILITSLIATYLLILLLYTQRIEKVVGERTIKAKELAKALHTLQETQVQLVQTEKMSSLGQLVAGIAHEINNPVNFINGNLPYASQYAQELLKLIKAYQNYYPNPQREILEEMQKIDLEFIQQDLPKLISSMKMGTERIGEIVQALRNFSRLDESKLKSVNIHDGIDSTLLILQPRLKYKQNQPPIEVVKKYGHLPLVECYPGQLNQVFMNLIVNAIDVLDSYNQQQKYQKFICNFSQITITTEYVHPNINVRIADNGPGMTEDVKKHLFEPFFTTKPMGQGTGLGLSISYKIVVEKHQGALWCESAPGKGTEFWIEIPFRQNIKQSPSLSLPRSTEVG